MDGGAEISGRHSFFTEKTMAEPVISFETVVLWLYMPSFQFLGHTEMNLKARYDCRCAFISDQRFVAECLQGLYDRVHYGQCPVKAVWRDL